MKKWTDEELLSAVRERLAADRQAYNDLQVVTRKLEEMNRRLQESEALKSHFLSNIRNEINNPLTAIVGLAGQIVGGPPPEVVANFARLIYDQAHELDLQLRNIFLAAELESGEAAPEWAQVDVAGVVDSLCAALALRCDDKGSFILRHLPESLIFVSDAQKLAAIVGNLLANAVEFSPPGTGVEVLAACEETALKIVVGDSGPGIAPEDQGRAFDRFCQLETGTTKSHRGHGLGLSVSRALTELLGGTLTLESSPGQGCRLTLTLPAPVIDAVADLATDANVFLFDAPESF